MIAFQASATSTPAAHALACPHVKVIALAFFVYSNQVCMKSKPQACIFVKLTLLFGCMKPAGTWQRALHLLPTWYRKC